MDVTQDFRPGLSWAAPAELWYRKEQEEQKGAKGASLGEVPIFKFISGAYSGGAITTPFCLDFPDCEQPLWSGLGKRSLGNARHLRNWRGAKSIACESQQNCVEC
jgi:hypothetical protein